MADFADLIHPRNLADDAILLVRQWLRASAQSAQNGHGSRTSDDSSELLSNVLSDEAGLTFTKDFVDGVARPEDAFVAAVNLKKVAANTPDFLPQGLRLAVKAGGLASLTLPWAVVPLAKNALKRMVGHLIVDAPAEYDPQQKKQAKQDALGRALAKIRESGQAPNINVLGETVLGETEARRRAAVLSGLMERDDVDYVSVKLSSIASNITLWDFDEAVNRISARLLPLFEQAAVTRTFINLDMEEFRELDLTVAIFKDILDRSHLRSLSAGIALQAYLPDSYAALKDLTAWSAGRVDSGGAPIHVRFVKGANLPMEVVDATLHGWPRAPFSSKRETDTNYKRLLEYAMRPENVRAVRVGVASHNLFDIALAWTLAQARGVSDSVEFEMLLGMAPSQVEAVSRTVGSIRLYTPVVRPSEFEAAISYLVRRLDETSNSDNFLSALFHLGQDEEVFARESERFITSLAQLDIEPEPVSNRTQDRTTEWKADKPDSALFYRPAEQPGESDDLSGMTQAVLRLDELDAREQPVLEPAALPDALPVVSLSGFVNEPATDPSRPANREWATALLARAADSLAPESVLEAAAVTSLAQIDSLVDSVRTRAVSWGAMSGTDRGAVLRRVALGLAANRDRLIEAMVAETGKVIAEADPEVSEAIDFARYYAARAAELDAVIGARFVPSRLTVVTPPWNFPLAIAAGSTLAALAAGSGVILKPAPQARHCGALLAEVLWEAGVPRELMALVDLRDGEAATDDEDVVQADTAILRLTETTDLSRVIGLPTTPAGEGDLGRYLVSHPGVDRLLLTGAFETAELFRRQRPELQLMAETSGKNAIVVTPSADIDLAVADIVASAFGHSGQKCSAASLVILVGSMARSKRFTNQLEDAVRSLRVGSAFDPATQVGPLIAPPSDKLWKALTVLEQGESWLVEPTPIDSAGRLWSPGVKLGVKKGSDAHRVEAFGPVLGVMTALSLTEAIDIQNSVDYGLTAGLHSLDSEEIGIWVDNVQAGNLYVNRGITGAIVERQPFGGWKRSSVGVGFKAGGPNYLIGLGDWVSEEGQQSSTLHLRGLNVRVTALIEAAQPLLDYDEFDVLRRAALSDAYVWGTEFAEVHDVSRLGIERNLLRYWPAASMVRQSEDAPLTDLLRVLTAGLLAKAPLSLSVARPLPEPIRLALAELDITISVENDSDWYERVAIGIPSLDRVRLIGGDRARLARNTAQHPEIRVWAQPVTNAGRLELLPFLREQSLSVTAHRFGMPSSLTDELF